MIITTLVIHHSSSGKNTTIEQINEWHKARGFPMSMLSFNVGYHYVILWDGEVIQTRRDNETGCHTVPNDGKLGICVVGNFQNEKMSVAQLDSLISLVNRLKLLYNIQDVKGHREFNRTECPGVELYKWVLSERISWLQKLINILLNK